MQKTPPTKMESGLLCWGQKWFLCRASARRLSSRPKPTLSLPWTRCMRTFLPSLLRLRPNLSVRSLPLLSRLTVRSIPLLPKELLLFSTPAIFFMASCVNAFPIRSRGLNGKRTLTCPCYLTQSFAVISVRPPTAQKAVLLFFLKLTLTHWNYEKPWNNLVFALIWLCSRKTHRYANNFSGGCLFVIFSC